MARSPCPPLHNRGWAQAFTFARMGRFGTSDRLSRFTSEFLLVRLHQTMAYNLQANGLCERFCRSMKAALRAILIDRNLLDHLPWVTLGLCTSPKRSGASFGSAAAGSWGVPHRLDSLLAAHYCLPQLYVPRDLNSTDCICPSLCPTFSSIATF